MPMPTATDEKTEDRQMLHPRPKSEFSYKISPRVSSEVSKAITETAGDDENIAALVGIDENLLDFVCRARAGTLQNLSEDEHRALCLLAGSFGIVLDS